MISGPRTQIFCRSKAECTNSCQCIPANSSTSVLDGETETNAQKQSNDEILLTVIIFLGILLLGAIIAIFFCWITRSKIQSSLQIQSMANDPQQSIPQVVRQNEPKLDSLEVRNNEGINEGVHSNIVVMMNCQPGSVANQDEIIIGDDEVPTQGHKIIADSTDKANPPKLSFDSDGDPEVLADVETTDKTAYGEVSL